VLQKSKVAGLRIFRENTKREAIADSYNLIRVTEVVAAAASAASRLLRAYAVQVEALRRLRHGGSQFVRVEHVHVNDGGQAVIGPVAVDRTQGTG
jgi:hypothetical protein